MKYGFLKVAAVSPKLRVADVQYNVEQIKEEIEKQAKAGVELLVFPELCLCGYTCEDLLLQTALTDKCAEALKEIAEFTKEFSLLVFVGLPFLHKSKLYNCGAAVCAGKVRGVIPKTHIPNYGEFSERRYFSSAPEKMETANFFGEEIPFGREILFIAEQERKIKIACEICEDVWRSAAPSTAHVAAGATVVVNLSASNELVGKAEYRRTLLRAHSGKNSCGYVYATSGTDESTTDLVFSGHNIVAENGTVVCESPLFSGDPAVAELDVESLFNERKKNTDPSIKREEYVEIVLPFVNNSDLSLRKISQTPFVPTCFKERAERAELVLTMQSHALAKRLRHTGAKTAVIGVSGGLDSTLALLATVKAFEILKKDKKDIVAVTMPGFGTTDRTYENSLRLIRSLGATLREISIKDSVLQHFKDIGHDLNVHDATYENAQARTRTLILMDLANQTGGLVVGTGDLSELALGWCTYNGDHISMYALNASVPKTLVKAVVDEISKKADGELKEILQDILNTEISPELLPPDVGGKIAQKTEDLVGPYELHDFFLYRVLRHGDTPKKVAYLAAYAFRDKYGKETIVKWLKTFYRRFFSQQFKRSCSPDGVKIGSVSLSPRGDFRMPSDACAALWLEEAERIE